MKKNLLLILAACLLMPAAQAAGLDCAPLGHLPSFEIMPNNNYDTGTPELHDYEAKEFIQANGQPLVVKGRSCTAGYQIKPGVEEPAPLEIVMNYQQQMQQLGAKVVQHDSCIITGVLTKNGVETWMQVACSGGFGNVYGVTVVDKQPFKSVLSEPATGDYRLLGHLPGYSGTLKQKNFDEAGFLLVPDTDPVKVQGRHVQVSYDSNGHARNLSDVAVIENYAAAIRAKGGEVLLQNNTDLTGRFEDAGQQIWVSVKSLFAEVSLEVIEEKPFAASITPPKPDELKAALDKDGHVALYINFDFAKATIKADAKPVVDQVIALLKANPAYKLTVEGHTDNVGSAEANQKLSEARAASVVAALVASGIDKARLSSAGFGLSKPIADNNSSEGRAKNRRVELVKR